LLNKIENKLIPYYSFNEQILIGFLNFIEGGLMMVMYVFLNFKGGGLVMAIDKYILKKDRILTFNSLSQYMTTSLSLCLSIREKLKIPKGVIRNRKTKGGNQKP
jgi:hypothetical protein